MTSALPALTVNNIAKFFPVKVGFLKKSNVIRAVDGVNLSVNREETVGIVGESGCGKTTLARCILRLIEPTRGQIFFEDIEITKLKKKELQKFRVRMQMVFQDPFSSLDPRQKVMDIVSEPLTIHHICTSKKDRTERVLKVLEEVGLHERHLSRYPHEFSGGQRQRIAIARTIILNPQFVILDEPTSMLDVSVQGQILNMLQKLQNDFNLTYLFISHNLNVVKQMSDRIGVMYLGRLVEIASTGKIFEKMLHPYTKALISSVPRLYKREEKKWVLEGEIPSPQNPPPGCRFHPRCNYAKNKCSKEKPELVEIEDQHFVACHLYQNNV